MRFWLLGSGWIRGRRSLPQSATWLRDGRAQVTFKILDARGNVFAVANETGTWHAWDGINEPPPLNLTFGTSAEAAPVCQTPATAHPKAFPGRACPPLALGLAPAPRARHAARTHRRRQRRRMPRRHAALHAAALNAATPHPLLAAPLLRFFGAAWQRTCRQDVAAKIGSTTCALEKAPFITPPDTNAPVYSLSVPSEDAVPGCGHDGALITFFVGTQQAPQTAVWHAGEDEHIDLIIGPSFALFTGAPGSARLPAGEVIVPYVGNVQCGYASLNNTRTITGGGVFHRPASELWHRRQLGHLQTSRRPRQRCCRR